MEHVKITYDSSSISVKHPFFVLIQGYSPISNNGWCVHRSGKNPPECYREHVSSQSLCEDHCTAMDSCIAINYYTQANIYCNLLFS